MKLKRYVLDDHLRSEMPKGDWVLYADAEVVEKENAALRSRVAELEAERQLIHKHVGGNLELASLAEHVKSIMDSYSGSVADKLALRVRLATLEAPPVVPAGFKIERGAPGEWWIDWSCGTPKHNDMVSCWRACVWANDHDQRPPHASDGMATPEPPKPARKVLPVGHIPGPDGVRVGMVLRWTLYDNAIVNLIEFGSAYTTRGTVRLDTAGRMSLAAPFEVPND